MKQLLLFFLILFKLNLFAQWYQLNSGTTNELSSVFFINQNIGWAVGTGGIILKTIDGGQNWINQTSGTVNTLYKIYFINTNIGMTVGDNGTILKTTDSGANWENKSIGTVYFF